VSEWVEVGPIRAVGVLGRDTDAVGVFEAWGAGWGVSGNADVTGQAVSLGADCRRWEDARLAVEECSARAAFSVAVAALGVNDVVQAYAVDGEACLGVQPESAIHSQNSQVVAATRNEYHLAIGLCDGMANAH
jgi:hypothetical protein